MTPPRYDATDLLPRRPQGSTYVASYRSGPAQVGQRREQVEPGTIRGTRAVGQQHDPEKQQLLAVATRGGEVVGTLQLTVIPGLSRRGMRRALIEAVRVRALGLPALPPLTSRSTERVKAGAHPPV